MGKPLIVVRNQNNINFTTVDNYFIKDKTLSTKAKGLLIQLLALPDGWTFSKKGIQSIVKEGREFVENCMAELKEHGYLVIDKYMNQETGFYEYEYQIYAIPIYCKFLPDGNIINRKTNDLLPFSFEKNITLGKEATKYSLKELITKFHLESIFDKNRESLDIEHLNLSGGEKQRICLARALYRNKKWLFLDEAFSAIDKNNSDIIHKFILSDPNMTVLSIEHKITEETVSLYDDILLFKNKKIISMSTEEYLNSNFYKQEYVS